MGLDYFRIHNPRLVIAIGCLAAIGAIAASSSHAAIVNGSFENGFTGWTNHPVVNVFPWVDPLLVPGTGLIYTRSQLGQLTPTDATKFAVLEVNYVPYSYSDLTVGGARISQSFSAQANDLLSFDLAGYWQAPSTKGGVYLNGLNIVPISLGNGDLSETWSHHQFRLPQSANYNLSFAVESVFGYLGGVYFDNVGSKIAIDNVRLDSYGAAENPVLPTSTGVTASGVPVFNFNGAQSGQWFDPPATSGFSYQMTSASLFTKILDFPTGFDSPFVVSVDGAPIGHFGPGQSVDFTGFAGGGISSFQVSGINPTVDSDDPLAFPLKLQFSTTTADFTMQAVVPEPSTLVLVLCGAAAAMICCVRTKRTEWLRIKRHTLMPGASLCRDLARCQAAKHVVSIVALVGMANVAHADAIVVTNQSESVAGILSVSSDTIEAQATAWANGGRPPFVDDFGKVHLDIPPFSSAPDAFSIEFTLTAASKVTLKAQLESAPDASSSALARLTFGPAGGSPLVQYILGSLVDTGTGLQTIDEVTSYELSPGSYILSGYVEAYAPPYLTSADASLNATLSVAAIPEPSTLLLALCGAAGLALFTRRERT